MKRRGFLSAFLTVGAGGAAGQLAAILAAPALSRIYTPADYGASAIAQSLVMVLVLVGTLRYEGAIMTARSDVGRANAFGLCVVALAAISGGMGFVLLAGWLLGGALPWAERMFQPILFFAPPLLFLGVMQGMVAPHVLLRNDAARLVSLGGAANGAAGAAAQIALGLAGWGAVGLLSGRLLGFGLSLLTMMGSTWTRVFRRYLPRIRRRGMARMARAHADQAVFLAPAGLLNVVSTQMPVFYFAAVFGGAATGAFFFAQSLANAGLMVYRSTIAPLSLREAVHLRQIDRPILPFVLKVTAAVAVLAFATAAVLFVVADRLVPLLFGPDWVEAGMVVAWMGFFFAMSAVHLPAASLSPLVRYQTTALATQVCQVLGVAAALHLGSRSGDFEVAVASVSITMTAIYAASLLVILALIRRDDRATAARRAVPTAPADPG